MTPEGERRLRDATRAATPTRLLALLDIDQKARLLHVLDTSEPEPMASPFGPEGEDAYRARRDSETGLTTLERRRLFGWLMAGVYVGLTEQIASQTF